MLTVPKVPRVPNETYHPVWSPLLDEVSAEALDCLQVNLALLVDRHRGAGAHLVLGAAPRFEVGAGLGDRLAQAHDLAGLRVARRFTEVDGARLAELAAEHGVVYAVADVHDLAWTPYAGRRHEEHSFLVCSDCSDGSGSTVSVVDAYHDETPWGPARPGTWRLEPADLAGLPPSTVFVFDVDDVVAVPAAVRHRENAVAERSIVDSFVADRPDIVQDVWLLGRSRELYALWLASLPDTPVEVVAAARSHATAVAALAGRLFVAGRRGAAVPGELLDALRELLRADADLVAAVAAGTAAPVAAVVSSVDDGAARPVVLAAIAAVLRIDEADVLAAGSLRELPGFNSFRLVEIIERSEGLLGVELSDEDFTPDTLTHAAALCAAFAKALPR